MLWLQHLPRRRLARKPPSHMKNLLNNENTNELTIFSLLYFYDTALGSIPSWQQTKTDPRPQVVQKNYRSRPDRRITHPTRSDTSMQPYTCEKSCKSGLHLQITERNLQHCHNPHRRKTRRSHCPKKYLPTSRGQQQGWKADKLQRQVMVCVGHLLHLLTLLYTTAH